MTILYPHNRLELREWLTANASKEKEAYVHCIRRRHESIIPYLDVVEEALCFWWIDSTCRPCDEGDGHLQRLSPRRKNSRRFHPLYVRMRLDNIQRCKKHISEERSLLMLNKYIQAARDGKMTGEWNDGGRLLDY